MDPANWPFFDRILEYEKAYRITGFFCEPTDPYYQTLRNNITLRLGKITTFELLSGKEKEFPQHHFEFVDHSQLHTRLPPKKPDSKATHQMLADYVAGIVTVNDVKEGNRPLRTIITENLEGNIVEVTLWGKQAREFPKSEVDSGIPPVMLAVTACRVSSFKDQFQLSGSATTNWYTNPNVDVVRQMQAQLREKYRINPPLKVVRRRFEDETMEKNRNREPLSILINQDPITFKFMCEATITAVNENRTWFYTTCTDCKKKPKLTAGVFDCEDHGELRDPVHKYCFKATVQHKETRAEFSFFSPAGDTITNVPCAEVVKKFVSSPSRQFPSDIKEIIGKTRLFQIRYSPGTKKGAGEFIVDAVLELEDPEDKTGNNQSTETGTSSVRVAHDETQTGMSAPQASPMTTNSEITAYEPTQLNMDSPKRSNQKHTRKYLR